MQPNMLLKIKKKKHDIVTKENTAVNYITGTAYT